MSLTVTPTPSDATASIGITVTGTLESWITLVRTRTDTGAQSNVRGATLIGTTSGPGTLNFTDYEAPLGVPVTYTANVGVFVNTVPTQDNSYVSGTAMIDAPAGLFWLKNLSTPALNMSSAGVSGTGLLFGGMGDLKLTGRQQLSKVIGRKNPVGLTDVRDGRTSTMTFLTLDLATRLTLLGFFASSSSQVFMLQFTPGDGFDDLYFLAEDITERRPSPVSTDPTRAFDVVYYEVDAPADSTTMVGANSYQLMLGWTSYQHVLNQRATYQDLLNTAYGSRVGDTP